MYNDASYYALIPSTQVQKDQLRGPKHKRRVSLLKQPSENVQADADPTDGIASIREETQRNKNPPQATLTRRAQSYSDFYDAMSAQLEKESGTSKEGKDDVDHIKTELEFGTWYHNLEDDLLGASHEDFQEYYDQLDLSQSHLDSLLTNTTSTLDLLSMLSASFTAVETQTTAFREQCEGLLLEQERLTKLADDIEENVQYYNYLESLTRRLNAPGAGNSVGSQGFSQMLSQLDECLDYMQDHTSHRESQTYRSRYRLLLTRALTLIRVRFVGSLRDIAADVSKRIADKQLNDTTMSALLYAKFRVGASELKDIGQEIRKRAVPPPGSEPGAEGEYQSLMNELYTSYSATRGKLIIPLVRKKLGEIAMAPSTSKNLVTFARNSISYIRGVCSDEFELWGEWFEDQTGLYEFLESVCEPLYDHLRPRIIHETQLLRLCELCTLLQTRYMSDQDEEAEPLDIYRLDFSALIHPALEDAQTRLVFKTQAILRDEIENYRPKPEDLDYPARKKRVSLSGTKSNDYGNTQRKGSITEHTTPTPKTPMVVEEELDSPTDADRHWGFDTEAISEGWYPTLRKAIWLLNRIYRLVNPTIFDDLAHQIVHATTLSLHHAAPLLANTSTPTDAHLFLIAHLLALKHRLHAFDTDLPPAPDLALDFSGMASTLAALRAATAAPRSLWAWRTFRPALLPRVVASSLDAPAHLDARLRAAITDFTALFARRMVGPIAEEAVARRGFDPDKAVAAVREGVVREVRVLRGKVEAYLDDGRVRETLVGAVRESVLGEYERFWRGYVKGRGGKGGSVRGKGKGKGREDEVWDLETFAEWSAWVFGVGGEGGVEDEDEDVGSD